ncbi:MAG: periplasmic heavy metal sensor [Paracoccaceae bacterium]
MADTSQPTDPKQKSTKWLRVALGVSLALNLAVAGIVGGAVLKGGRDHHSSMVRDLGFGPFSEALSREDRAALRGAFFQRVPDMRANRNAMREDFAAVLGALRADPFDPAALTTALERQQGRMADQLAIGQALIADHIAAMTPEARRGFADRLEQSLTKRAPPKP